MLHPEPQYVEKALRDSLKAAETALRVAQDEAQYFRDRAQNLEASRDDANRTIATLRVKHEPTDTRDLDAALSEANTLAARFKRKNIRLQETAEQDEARRVTLQLAFDEALKREETTKTALQQVTQHNAELLGKVTEQEVKVEHAVADRECSEGLFRRAHKRSVELEAQQATHQTAHQALEAELQTMAGLWQDEMAMTVSLKTAIQALMAGRGTPVDHTVV